MSVLTESAPGGASTLTRVGPRVVVVVSVLALIGSVYLPLVAAPIAVAALVVAIIGRRQNRPAFKWAYVAAIAAVIVSVVMLFLIPTGDLLSDGDTGATEPERVPGPVVDAPLPS